MATTTARAALGLGALFLGGLLGGLVGSVFFRGSAAPAGVVQHGELLARDDGLRAAIEALTSEVRRMGVVTPASPDLRAPVLGDGTASKAALDSDELVAALDRLTQALSLSRGSMAPGGVGISPLVLPHPGSRTDALVQLVDRDWEDISAELRFLTYQQVLDRFGRPDEVSPGAWFYRLGSGDGSHTFTFNFQDGYLWNVYP